MKSKKQKPTSSYERARKRVNEIKGFYGHLAAYIIVGLIVLFTRAKYISFIRKNSALQDVEFLNWIDWNVYGTPIIWGIALGIHGLSVFGKNPFLGKAWEERQIQKYMKEEK